MRTTFESANRKKKQISLIILIPDFMGFFLPPFLFQFFFFSPQSLNKSPVPVNLLSIILKENSVKVLWVVFTGIKQCSVSQRKTAWVSNKEHIIL